MPCGLLARPRYSRTSVTRDVIWFFTSLFLDTFFPMCHLGGGGERGQSPLTSNISVPRSFTLGNIRKWAELPNAAIPLVFEHDKLTNLGKSLLGPPLITHTLWVMLKPRSQV